MRLAGGSTRVKVHPSALCNSSNSQHTLRPSPAMQRLHCSCSKGVRAVTPLQWPAQRQHELFAGSCHLRTAFFMPWTSRSRNSAAAQHTRHISRELNNKRLCCLPSYSEGSSSSTVNTITYAAASEDSAEAGSTTQQRPASEAALAAAEAIAAAAEAAAAALDAEAVTATAAAWQADVFSKAVLGNRTSHSSAQQISLKRQHHLTKRTRSELHNRHTSTQASQAAALSKNVDQQGDPITSSTSLEILDVPGTTASQNTTPSSEHASPQQSGTPDLLGLKQAAAARAEAAATAGAAADDLEQAWQEAVKAVSAAVGIPVAIVYHQTELLRLLLPDMDQTLAAQQAARLQWEAVCAALQLMQPAGGSVDWAKDEAVIMDMVMTAVRSSERDGNDAFLHNSLMMSISNFFMAVRCHGQCDPDSRRQHYLLVSQLQQCVEKQQDRAAQLMHQQVKLAATTEQLPEKLIGLKSSLATANVSQLVLRHPPLLRHQPEQLKQMVAQAESLLSSQLDAADVVAVLEAEPWLLEQGALIGCIEGLRELFPAKEPCALLLQHIRTGGSKLLAEFKQQAFNLVGLKA